MTLVSALPLVAAAVCGILALLGLIRSRRSVGDWSFVAGMILLGTDALLIYGAETSADFESILRWRDWRLAALSLLPGTWLAFSLTYARGNFRQFLHRWRWLLATAFGAPLVLAALFFNQLVVAGTNDANEPVLELTYPGVGIHFSVLVGSILVLMNLERTFRDSVGTTRWRIKFMLLGVCTIFVVRAYTSVQALLFRSVISPLSNVDAAAVLIGGLLVLRSIFRTRSTDLDIYPSQKVLQNSLTVLLAGIYLLVVGVLARLVRYFGGDTSFTVQAFLVLLAVVGLAVLLQSDRVRLQIKLFVSRHFRRPVYDYEAAWRTFTEGTASRVETLDLCRALVRLTAELFQALSVGIWLIDERRECLELAASTYASDKEEPAPTFGPAESSAAIARFREDPSPIDIETEKSDWATALRKAHPIQFPNYPARRVCVPIVARGEALGLIAVGDRVAGAEFSTQDFDMLKCIGAHAAAGVLNLQLSRKLLQAKEFEAFQTMATFFVHDMKNAASTLNLMLQNLPLHFDDPEFRQDALRGIEKTVTHINRLTGRLSQLRSELKIQPVDTDLNQIVATALEGIVAGEELAVEKELAELPSLKIDRDQFAKVVSNLVLNARESITGPGFIRVTTSLLNDWAVVSVADSGCGMSPEFVRRSLFRPFQSTKKHGLGIGMFQSRMIIEAHGGRISVNSSPGKGTVFEVFLPLQNSA